MNFSNFGAYFNLLASQAHCSLKIMKKPRKVTSLVLSLKLKLKAWATIVFEKMALRVIIERMPQSIFCIQSLKIENQIISLNGDVNWFHRAAVWSCLTIFFLFWAAWSGWNSCHFCWNKAPNNKKCTERKQKLIDRMRYCHVTRGRNYFS